MRTISALMTAATVIVVFAIIAFALARNAPASQVQATAAQAALAPAPTQPVVSITIDGLVDPAIASYVHRAAEIATNESALLVVDLDASGGLDASVRDVSDTLRFGSAPTVAHIATTNTTTAMLAQAAHGTIASVPSQAQKLEMEPLEALWHRLLDPSVAYVLFTIGLFALFVEIAHPGAILPGISGVVCLGLGSVGFTALPINPLGAVIVIAGVALMGIELKAPTHGALTLVGVAAIGAGSLWLYSQSVPSTIEVASPVLGGVLIAGTGLGIMLARIARRIRALPPVFDLNQLIGAHGRARSGLEPDGVVHVQGQLWSARVRGTHVVPGEPVRVLARNGLVLEVESAAHRSAATQKGAVQ